jgi:SAM-dependent methyltransferase
VPAHVAGVEIELGDTEYRLRGCRRCGFQFKDPPIDHDRLMACYAAASSDNWETDPDPQLRQFDLLEGIVREHARGPRMLDIGCFNGAMLNYFGRAWQKFGIEPSQDARRLAERRGVHVLGSRLEDVDHEIAPFDVVLAIDVVEHLVEPLPFFDRVRTLLAPQGIFLILTGDTSSLAWRLQGGNYWYSSLPEHVSFYSRRTLDWIGQRLGMTGVEYRRVCHKKLPLWRWISDMLKSALYVSGRAVGGFGIPALRRLFVERRGPTIQAAHDHLIYVYRKP